MSQQDLRSQPHISEPIEQLLREIYQTPKEYWPNLLQMIRLFRESVTMKQAQSDAWAKAMDELKNPDPVKRAERQKALSELLRSWREEGDEEEQKETGKVLRQAFDDLSPQPQSNVQSDFEGVPESADLAV
ncbi:MAG: hypothetical protein KME26_00955 [Oscillatoria princeps RMCB-10]|jgi:uncharacterized NAD(P)/FAD-binding protein YdhS|nr:hypothetical protein [Oscillatoria princeps RMCB-10]